MVNICVPPPVIEECCLANICFECAVSSPDAFGDEIVWNQTVTSYMSVIPLLFIGIWNLYGFQRTRQLTNYEYLPILRLNSAVYALGTAIFGLSRIYYQISRPVLTLAAIHNLCEWVFACHGFFRERRQRALAMLASSVFIMSIIGLVNVMITELPIYSATEQIPGLAIDILLPIIWWILYRQNAKNNKNSEVKYVYLNAFAAHFVHLFLTILPLIIEQLTRNQSEFLSRLMSLIVFLSVPWNHLMYTRFVTMYEKHVDKVHDIALRKKTDDDHDDDTQQDPNTIVNSPQCVKSQAGKLFFWYGLCLVLSLFPNVIIPGFILSPCDVDVEVEQPSFLMGTTEVIIEDGFNEQFEYQFKSKHLRSNALNFEGNKYYFIGQSSDNPNKYIFSEGWESLEAVQKWIGSEYVKSVFNEHTQPMMASTVLSSYRSILDELIVNTDSNEKVGECEEMAAGSNSSKKSTTCSM